ncbi:hypothetical protein BGZ76_011486 [Entomortierella beljakovae]|nr:hypothetical protein BGZ76_011486 [Entomortierella beljakovae]
MTIHIKQQYQLFQLNDTIEKVYVRNGPASNGNTTCYVGLEDIQDVFQNARRFKLDDNPIPFLTEPNGVRIQPLRIDFYPDRILDVITDIPQLTNTRTVVRTSRKLETQSSPDLLLSSSSPIQTLNSTLVLANMDSVKSDLAQNLSALEKRVMEEKNESNEVLHEMIQIQRHILELLVETKEMDNLILKMQVDAKEKEDLMLKIQLDAKEKGDKMISMQEQMIDLQNQALDRLAMLQRHAEAILIQNFELHEYPIPRLFIILPADQSNWNPLKILENKFRLHFLCECGDTTEASNADQKQIHIAKHEGYRIRHPTEFYHKYGKYILILLQALKMGVEIADKSIPTIHAPKVLNPGIDYSISYMKALSIKNPILENIDTIDNYESLEGAELRQLDKFLQINDENRKLGNLYRITLETGHVKWVCLDHYCSTYKEKEQRAFENVVEMNGGSYDSQLGRVVIELGSSIRAKEFFDVLPKARHVYDLDITFDWDCSITDLKLFRNVLKIARVSVLKINTKGFQTSTTNKLLSTSTEYEILLRMAELASMKLIHIVLPNDFIKLSTFQPKISPQLHRLTIELGLEKNRRDAAKKISLFPQSGNSEFKQFFITLKTNTTLTSLNLRTNSIGNEGTLALSEALKTNTALTTLDLQGNLIGNEGALALSGALKTNTTLTTLNLQGSMIRREGAIALSEALKTNTTLTALNLQGSLIDKEGVLALSDALKTNTTLTNLNLMKNSIEIDGAHALSEALKTNATLTTLDLQGNIIGKKGAHALSDALKTNTALTTLNLRDNLIRNEGTLSLSEVLKTNTALTTLNLMNNLIEIDGALALSEALRTNTTLTTLNLQSNMIEKEGALALSEALKTNTALTNLNLGYNSIWNEGALALSEALETNATLTTLDLVNNSIRNEGALALSKALRINTTLTALYLASNIIWDEAALALSEARKTNTTLTTLDY